MLGFAAAVSAQPVLTINGLNADYETTHVFVDEVAGTTVPLTVVFQPNAANLTKVEAFSNLNNRDRATNDANGDGIPDGILPPDGNSVVAGNDVNYYTAYTMTNMGNGTYQITLNAAKTGAYRLTARYQVAGNTNWVWYGNFTDGGGTPYRDFAIVVSPVKAQQLVMYELNVMNANAQGTNQGQQSTFVDLWNGPGAFPSNSTANIVNFNYLTNLGINTLWIQPIHPIGIVGRDTNPATGQPWNVGSPYSIKNYFAVNPLLSKGNSRAAGMTEFSNFVAQADAAGLNVFLDVAFNHTSFDCELNTNGVNYFAPPANPTNLICDWEARFYSLTNSNNGGADYCERAYNASTIPLAPDRGDFAKWVDVHDIYFGYYAALVCDNPQDNTNYLNEGDWFDYTTTNASGHANFDNITQHVWQYFADYVPFWLDQTGCPAGTPANQSYKGIDGIRADFAQGLPPQCWEYIINVARSRKWDFMFLAESLDGGNVSYRSNRHFDLLNENILFDLQNAAQAGDYYNLFQARRNAYGFSMILLNNLSHDEQAYSDPYEALIRYATCATIDGCPDTFYGEELGISTSFGFSVYGTDFGKTIPEFETFNSMQPVLNPANRTFALQQLYPVYAGINRARLASPALRNSNRYFLYQNNGNTQPEIYAVAKYVTANASPGVSDVVFGFVNLDRNDQQTGVFNVNITQNGSNLFGIQPGRFYNVRNIAAYTGADTNRPNYFLWPNGGYSGAAILDNGIYVGMNPVPTSNAGWTNDPYEAQFLKLYDVTPPPTPAAPGTSTNFPLETAAYAIGHSATFSWSAVSDPVGGISGYILLVGTSPGASNIFAGPVGNVTNYTVSGAFNQTLYATVEAVNNAGIAGAPGPGSGGTILLDPNGDADGDGMSNYNEYLCGTDPLNAHSVFEIVSIAPTNNPSGTVLTWSSVPGKRYQVVGAPSLQLTETNVSPVITATSASSSYPAPPGASNMYYRVQLVGP